MHALGRWEGGGGGDGGGKSEELGSSYTSPLAGSKTLGQSCNLPVPQFSHQKKKQTNGGRGERNYNLYLAKALED